MEEIKLITDREIEEHILSECVAQAWCDPRVEDREMDVELAQVMIESLEARVFGPLLARLRSAEGGLKEMLDHCVNGAGYKGMRTEDIDVISDIHRAHFTKVRREE